MRYNLLEKNYVLLQTSDIVNQVADGMETKFGIE
jgi:hypothetical protein